MWIIVKPDGAHEDRGNLSSIDLLPTLLPKFKDAVIYRTKEECHNEFGALAFAQNWEQAGEREEIVIDDEGNETIIKHPIMVLKSAENTYAVEGSNVVVRDKLKAELGRFELEKVYDPNSNPPA
jgi:hypothetical protein